MPLTRRSLLELLCGSTFYFSAARPALAVPPAGDELTPASFPQGVASGDPRPDSVILWTRAQPEQGEPVVNLLLEVSRDAGFTQPVLRQPLSAHPAGDYTVRAVVNGLDPDRHYYYRFRGAGGSLSRPGRTRTAPAPDAERPMTVAFASCQSFENGYYGSWARMLADDLEAPEGEGIDLVLHLGDFIYERCWPTRYDGSPQARYVPPFPDGRETDKYRYAVSLADYRLLYRTYLSDPHLQAARARWPFVCTWDDHEFSNDCFQSYSTYDETPRLEARRKLSANQAWFEYIPAALDELQDQPAHGFSAPSAAPDNATAVDSLRIYRRLGFGRYLDLVLTDNRSYRTPPALAEGYAASLGLPLNTVRLVEIADAGREYGGGNPPATLPYRDAPNPARDREAGTMLGAAQRRWFIDTLAASTAHWKVWGNSLPVIPMRLDLSSLPFTVYEDSIFNVDAWAGYPRELRGIIDALVERGIGGVVSLSGDHHMHGAGLVNRSPAEAGAVPVMVDFTVAGISSSPIFEELEHVARQNYSAFRTLVYRETDGGIEPVWNLTMLDGVLPAYLYAKTGLKTAARWLGPNPANPGLSYVDTTANGYAIARFDASMLTVRMVTLSDCRPAFTTPPAPRHVATLRVPRWEAGEAPRLEGPQFEYGAPFPFDAGGT